jgi:ketosteroid isomerase-like protein
MTKWSVTIVLFGSGVLTGHMLQGPAAWAANRNQTSRPADLAAVEKLRQQDISATVARDPVALTDLWTDDAIRIGVGAPADIGKPAIRASNERQTANKTVKVLSYVPETKDFTFLEGGWAVEWRTFTASIVDSAGGEAKQLRGTVMLVLKKLPDGSWKCFRGLGGTEPGPSAKAGGL